MIKVKFNENELVLNEGTTDYEAAVSVAPVSREVVAAKVDGVVSDLTRKLTSDCEIELLTFEDPDGAHVFRHTAAHILAQAVKRLYPDAKLTIGPAIENGFYYDFDCDTAFTPDDLKKIESEMQKIVKENLKIERFELPREEAIKLMTELGEPYKVQLIE